MVTSNTGKLATLIEGMYDFVIPLAFHDSSTLNWCLVVLLEYLHDYMSRKMLYKSDLNQPFAQSLGNVVIV